MNMASILLVEDDTTLAETLMDLLAYEDFHVTWVSDGQKALDATFVERFDLMLFDVNVPFVNGFELLKLLRESGDDTPAIFITALTDIASLSQGFEVGADDYLKKPFDFVELLIVKRILSSGTGSPLSKTDIETSLSVFSASILILPR